MAVRSHLVTSLRPIALLFLDGLTNDVQRSEVMATSKKDASLASKQLQDKKSTTSAKSVAGSDLAQAKGKKK